MSARRRFASPAVALTFASLASVASSQSTYVVDDNGGPGVDFTSLASAVAASVDGDTLLVRAGNYGAFTLDKALTIVADSGAVVARGASITGVSAARGARVAGLDYTDLQISACTGPVLLDGTDVLGSLSPQSASPVLSITDCSDVRFQLASIEGLSPFPAGYYGHHGVYAANARVEFNASQILAGNGRSFSLTVSETDGGSGGLGLRCGAGARVHLARTAVRGGNGGNGCSALCSGVGGDGGDGIEVDAGGEVIVAGSSFTMVRGGARGTGAQNGVAGYGIWAQSGSTLRYSGVTILSGANPVPPIRADGGSSVTLAVPADPTLELLGTPLPGQFVTFRLYGSSGDIGRLQQGNQALVAPDGLSVIERLNNRIRLHPMGAIATDHVDYVALVPAGAGPGWFRVFQGFDIDAAIGDLVERTNSVLVISR